MLNANTWQIELEGSELARIELSGADVVIVLAAARVPAGLPGQRDEPASGHLQGVRIHLMASRWEGPAHDLVGRIDEAAWTCEKKGATSLRAPLIAPSSGVTPIRLSLRTALGDTWWVHSQTWRVELLAGCRFTPSLAC